MAVEVAWGFDTCVRGDVNEGVCGGGVVNGREKDAVEKKKMSGMKRRKREEKKKKSGGKRGMNARVENQVAYDS